MVDDTNDNGVITDDHEDVVSDDQDDVVSDDTSVDDESSIERKFNFACDEGNLDVVKSMWEAGQIKLDNDRGYAFVLACEHGHNDVAQWIIATSLTTSDPITYGSAVDGYHRAKENNHFAICDWLGEHVKDEHRKTEPILSDAYYYY